MGDVPSHRMGGIVNGKRSITADSALRLQRYLGVEAQFWLNLQTEYDLPMITGKIWPDMERRIIPVNFSEKLENPECFQTVYSIQIIARGCLSYKTRFFSS